MSIHPHLDSAVKGLMALPVGVYEMSLAVWLIVKGFHGENLAKLRAKTASSSLVNNQKFFDREIKR
jgi:hypothetical protein